MRAMIAGLALATALLSSPAAAACDRACLTGLTDQVIAALGKGDAAAVPGLSTARMTENGKVIAPAASQLSKLKTLSYRQYFAEPARGAVGFYGSGQEADRPVMFLVRLATAEGKVTEVETVIAHDGEASIFKPQDLPAPRPNWDAIVPKERRVPRDQMIAIANAYFDGVERADGSKVPVTEACDRIENGARMTHDPKRPFTYCNSLSALNYIKTVRDRRFPLVDEERGLVWSIIMFDIPGGPSTRIVDGKPQPFDRPPRSLLLGELFKVEAGKINDIVVVMRNTELGAPDGWD